MIGEKIQQITRDHSLVQEMVRMGELDPEQARKHPKKNIITRALGAEKTVDIRLIPYYAWGNRGKGEMTVWMPLAR